MSGNNALDSKIPTLQKLRSVFARERQVVCDNQFDRFIKILEQREFKSEQQAKHAIEVLYAGWAEKFELLKREFNNVRELFQGVEQRVTGWYCVSPNSAQWNAVASTKTGYTFASGIMKNHHRRAPRSEKSLTVSFALDEKPTGMGDESSLGYSGAIGDQLLGLEACSAKSLKEQADGVRYLHKQMEGKNIVFRLNHASVGQQVAKLPIAILEEYSLRELCQGLFLTLNNDILEELKLNAALENPQKLIASNDQMK